MQGLFGPMGASVRQDVLLATGNQEMPQSSSDAEDYEERVACRKAKNKLFQERERGRIKRKKGKGKGESVGTDGSAPGLAGGKMLFA